MSYRYQTQYDSPNFTPASQVPAIWGVPRTIEAIAIHWWGDPATNPTYEGVINTLLNPARQASAHFVATGTGRRVACLVNLEDASWCTNQANPYTISIEADPRCTDEDYDVVAELISQIRYIYGDLPLIRHSDIVSTRCPGNWDLIRLDQLSKLKDGSGDWGVVTNLNQSKPVPEATQIEKKTVITKDITYLWDLTTNPNFVSVKSFAKGEEIEVVAEIKFNGATYYQTAWSFGKNKWGVNSVDVIDKPVSPVEPPVTPVEPKPDPEPMPEPETPTEPVNEPNYDKENNTLLKLILDLLNKLIEKIGGIFR